MDRLEKQLIRTYRAIERLMDRHQDTTRIKSFYRLIHRYETLHDRYVALHRRAYNPALEVSNGWEGDIENQHG